jgi:dTDP-4-dehydrorhamnose reductase
MSQDIKTKFLVIGSSGQLALSLKAIADERFHFVGRPEFDVQNVEQLKQVFKDISPVLVINCSAYTTVDLAETEIENAYNLNAEAVKNLSLQCNKRRIPLIHISTDYVFDGNQVRSYYEDDVTNPLSIYGKSKLAGENFVRSILHEHIIIRTSWVFSEYGNNFVKTMVRLSEIKDELNIVNDQVGSPTCASNIASTIMKIANKIISGEDVTYGTYNYTDSPAVTWYEFAKEIFKLIHVNYNKKVPISKPILSSEYKTAAIRPLNSQLNCSKIEKNFGIKSADWHAQLKICVDKFIENKIIGIE